LKQTETLVIKINRRSSCVILTFSRVVVSVCAILQVVCCGLTDGSDELLEGAEGKQRFWKLSKEKLQSSGDDVDLLPLPVLQVQLLLCRKEQQQKKKKPSNQVSAAGLDSNSLRVLSFLICNIKALFLSHVHHFLIISQEFGVSAGD